MGRFVFLLMLIPFWGCLPPLTGETISDIVASSQAGPYQAASVTVPIQTRISDSRPLITVFPSDDAGTPDLSGAPYPAAVFVHGGAVTPARYQWVANHLATRGYVVLMPDHLIQAAIVEADNTKIMLDQARQWVRDGVGVFQDLFDPAQAMPIMGHSLGAVSATEVWSKYGDDIAGLVNISGNVTSSVDVTRRADSQVLFLTGSRDGRIEPERSLESFRTIDVADKWFAVVDGMNHYAWVDDPTPAETATDLDASRPIADTRPDALRVLNSWLDAQYYPDREMLWPSGPFPNVEFQQ